MRRERGVNIGGKMGAKIGRKKLRGTQVHVNVHIKQFVFLFFYKYRFWLRLRHEQQWRWCRQVVCE
jgi:hypothetical protein